MFPELKEANQPTSPAVIESFDRSSGLRLPRLYTEFLLDQNGGRPVSLRLFPIRGMPNNPFGAVNFFFGINADLPVYDLIETWKWFRKRIPSGIVLIAENGGGDYIGVDLRDRGERIVFWDHRHFWGTGEWRESDLYHVADTFEEFLASLRPNSY